MDYFGSCVVGKHKVALGVFQSFWFNGLLWKPAKVKGGGGK